MATNYSYVHCVNVTEITHSELATLTKLASVNISQLGSQLAK